MKASNDFEKAILKYLESVKNSFPELSEAIKKEGKTITDCCNYIISEVKKKGVAAMADTEVFQMANDYYLSEKEIKPQKQSCKVVVASGTGEIPKPKREKKVKEEIQGAYTQLSMF